MGRDGGAIGGLEVIRNKSTMSKGVLFPLNFIFEWTSFYFFYRLKKDYVLPRFIISERTNLFINNAHDDILNFIFLNLVSKVDFFG